MGPICKRCRTCLGNFAYLDGSEDIFTFINVNLVPMKKKIRKIMDSCLFCYVEEDQKRFPSLDIPSKPEHLAEGHKNIGS